MVCEYISKKSCSSFPPLNRSWQGRHFETGVSFLEVMFQSLCAVAASLKEREAISWALFRKSAWSEQMRGRRSSWLYGRLSLHAVARM